MNDTENISVKDRMKLALSEIGISEGVFETNCGLAKGYVSSIGDSIRKNTQNKILSTYPDFDLDWVITGERPAIIENKNGNKFALLPNGEYLMSMPCVEVEAQAGLLDNYSDVVYLSEMNQYAMIVDKVYHGRYVAFKVEGNSMDDGSKNSIPKGCKIATRELGREHWTNKLHIKEYPYWVIYTTRNSKPLVKEIISHDIEKGEIICHSLNDSPEYADFPLKMDEINALFYVVDINRRISNKEY
ncbi:MAG: XRE family transcriptional regulator [Dysgonomonas sp.]